MPKKGRRKLRMKRKNIDVKVKLKLKEQKKSKHMEDSTEVAGLPLFLGL